MRFLGPSVDRMTRLLLVFVVFEGVECVLLDGDAVGVGVHGRESSLAVA